MVDITSLTLREEKLEQKAANIDKQKRNIHSEKLLILMESDDYLKIRRSEI